MKIYLARHGETDWNLKRTVQGRTDVPLNETGLQQAEELRKTLEKIEFDVCYASPLVRARETAEIAVNGRVQIILDSDIVERGFGELEGTYILNWKKYWDLTTNCGVFDVEPVKELLQRAERFLTKLKETYPNDAKILVVSHGGISRAMHFAIKGYDETTDFSDFYLKNGDVIEEEV